MNKDIEMVPRGQVVKAFERVAENAWNEQHSKPRLDPPTYHPDSNLSNYIKRNNTHRELLIWGFVCLNAISLVAATGRILTPATAIAGALVVVSTYLTFYKKEKK